MEHGDYLVVGSYRASRLRTPELVLYVLDWTELMWRFPTHPSVYWTGVWSGVWSPYTIGNRVCCMSIIINIRVARAQIHNTMPIRHALDDTRFCPACWFGWETLTHAHTHTHTHYLSLSLGEDHATIDPFSELATQSLCCVFMEGQGVRGGSITCNTQVTYATKRMFSDVLGPHDRVNNVATASQISKKSANKSEERRRLRLSKLTLRRINLPLPS